MNCKELIESFEKVGGKLKCNNQKCTLYPLENTCNIDYLSKIELDILLMKFAKYSYKYLSYLPFENNNNVEMLYYKVPTSGFIIKFNKHI
jgi:hypothetical protein